MALARIVRCRRAVLAAAMVPSRRPVAWWSTCRATAASASADRGALLRATHDRTSAGGSSRCLVLKAQRVSARRMLGSSGRPRASVSVAAVSARAMSFRYLAEASFHFMSTYLQANSYQVVSSFARSQAVGLPVPRLNASPLRAAVIRALRKLSACAALRNASFHSLAPTFQRTQYVVTSLPL